MLRRAGLRLGPGGLLGLGRAGLLFRCREGGTQARACAGRRARSSLGLGLGLGLASGLILTAVGASTMAAPDVKMGDHEQQQAGEEEDQQQRRLPLSRPVYKDGVFSCPPHWGTWEVCAVWMIACLPNHYYEAHSPNAPASKHAPTYAQPHAHTWRHTSAHAHVRIFARIC